jgi:DNA repair protein RadC
VPEEPNESPAAERSSPRIQELPQDERPREKLSALGAAALADSELIAILLRTGMKGFSAIDIARVLLEKFQGIHGISRASVRDLAKVKGVGPTKAVQLAAAFGLAGRLARESLARTPMNRPELIYELLGAEMRQLGKEALKVVLLDTRLCLQRVDDISLGSLSECIAHPREIFRSVIEHNAYSFILVHNHPSGDPTPSDADRRMTIRISEAARILQVNFCDHVIVGIPAPGRSPYFSFKENGII